jgi:hypothetical protein
MQKQGFFVSMPLFSLQDSLLLIKEIMGLLGSFGHRSYRGVADCQNQKKKEEYDQTDFVDFFACCGYDSGREHGRMLLDKQIQPADRHHHPAAEPHSADWNGRHVFGGGAGRHE